MTLISVFAVLEVLLLFVPNLYSYKYDYVNHHKDEISILFLGNSHIEEAVIPTLVGDHAFNLAISGREIEYDIELAKKIIPNLSHLKVVIMPLDYGVFLLGRGIENQDERKNKNIQNDISETMKCMYYKYMGIRIDSFWHWSEFLNSNEQFLMRFFRSKEENVECDSLGFIKLELNKRNKDWKYRALPFIVDKSKQRDDSLYNRLYSNYCILSQLCQDQGAKLILISTPVYKTYQQYESQVVLDERKLFAKMLQEKYSCVRYYDFSTIESFDDDDYNDASHLTETGAIKFSKLLHSIVDK